MDSPAFYFLSVLENGRSGSVEKPMGNIFFLLLYTTVFEKILTIFGKSFKKISGNKKTQKQANKNARFCAGIRICGEKKNAVLPLVPGNGAGIYSFIVSVF